MARSQPKVLKQEPEAHKQSNLYIYIFGVVLLPILISRYPHKVRKYSPVALTIEYSLLFTN